MATDPTPTATPARAPRRTLEHDFDIYEVASDGTMTKQGKVKAKSQVLAADMATGDSDILVVQSVYARLFKPVKKFVAS